MSRSSALALNIVECDREEGAIRLVNHRRQTDCRVDLGNVRWDGRREFRHVTRVEMQCNPFIFLSYDCVDVAVRAYNQCYNTFSLL